MIKYDENTKLQELAEIAIPYDPSTHNKDEFISLVQKIPQLEDSFKSKYSEEFAESVREKGKIYFIVNHVSWRSMVKIEPEIKLYYCGQDKRPTISVYF